MLKARRVQELKYLAICHNSSMEMDSVANELSFGLRVRMTLMRSA